MKALSEYSKQRQLSKGLPPEVLDERRLLFDADSNLLVVSCSLICNRIKFPQVYFRRLDEESYQPLAERVAQQLGESPERLSLDSPIFSSGSGLFAIVSKYGEPSTEQHVPIHVLGIALLKVPNLTTEVWRMSGNSEEYWFPIELVGCSPATDRIHAIVGIPPKEVPGPVDYWVAALDWSERAIRKIASLSGPYF